MSALKFFAEKPHSSVSDWIDILTKADYKDESYDGIPELVDAIDLQGTSGSAEVSRAIRKKLKHGNVHQQYRALVILKALVDNCGEKFRKIFQDGHLTDALKNLASDYDTDKRVKKKLLLVLSAWDEQYKDDPNMHFVAGILKQCSVVRRSAASTIGPNQGPATANQEDVTRMGLVEPSNGEEKKKKKKKVDVLGELSKSEKAKKKDKKQQQNKRAPIDFERDKEKIMQSIVEGSQASSNLVNAITLVNTKTDSLQKNERVQECLEQAAKVKAEIVRYIRLVENEDIIGTLIETNDRLMSAIEMYEQLSASEVDPDPKSTVLAKTMASTHLADSTSSNNGLSPSPFDDNDNNAAQNADSKSTPHIHPDLEDLTFGPGTSTTHLPAPMKPSFQVLSDDDDREDRLEQRASLSDFSDYESSDEETHNKNTNSHAGPSRRNYITVSDDDEEFTRVPLGKNNEFDNDPFADPFADEQPLGRR